MGQPTSPTAPKAEKVGGGSPWESPKTQILCGEARNPPREKKKKKEERKKKKNAATESGPQPVYTHKS